MKKADPERLNYLIYNEEYMRLYDEVLADLRRRDAADSSRATAPLRPADDAVHIDSTAHYIEEVIEQICSLAREAR